MFALHNANLLIWRNMGKVIISMESWQLIQGLIYRTEVYF